MSLLCSEDWNWLGLDDLDLDVADITVELDDAVLGSPADGHPFDSASALLDFEPLPACAVSPDSESAAAAASPKERVVEITPRRKRKRISSAESSPDCRSVSSRASTASTASSGPSSRPMPVGSVEIDASDYLQRVRVPHKYCTYHCSDSPLLRLCSEDNSIPGYAMYVFTY